MTAILIVGPSDLVTDLDVWWGVCFGLQTGEAILGAESDGDVSAAHKDRLVEALDVAHTCDPAAEPEPYSRLEYVSQDVNYDANKAGDA